jgi:hypothetical protein
MKDGFYKKDKYGNEILYLNKEGGFYLKFEKTNIVKAGEKVSLYKKADKGKPLIVFNDLIASRGYIFEYLPARQKYCFATEFKESKIKIIQPRSLTGEEEKERDYYIFSLLHEIGHLYLHKSSESGFDKLKQELQAWVWSIELAQVLLPKYLESINKEALKFFIVDCLYKGML